MSHEIYSRDSTVYLTTGADKFAALHRAVEQSGFVSNLLTRWGASGKSKADFLIAIKPNIMTASIHEQDSPVYTDPALVEDLIGLMHEQGFTNIIVVEAENVYNYSYSGRRVQAVAAMCGYTGNGYRILSMTEDRVPFNYGEQLGRHIVGREWLEADYRISFAKNKTHWQCYFTACIKNVYGCLPEWDKMKYYHHKRRGQDIRFYDAAVLICDRFPVHFGFMDAWVSGDGLTGHVRDADPNHTHTIFASENIFALDWVAGEKMQIHPLDNPVIRRAMQEWGTVNVTRVGDMTPWYPWNNVAPWTVALLGTMEEYYHVSRFMSRAMAAQQDARFKPVSREHWFFNLTHHALNLVDGLFTHPAPQASQPRTFEMALGRQ
ncbi:MAG TPA: DUF362 domain-containing protein [Anaerolineae bacterium]